jgi:hypothetical protein
LNICNGTYIRIRVSTYLGEIMGTKTYSMEPISVFFFKFSAPVRTTTHEWIRERVPMIYVLFVMFYIGIRTMLNAYYYTIYQYL